MMISGHKIRSIFECYNIIVDDKALRHLYIDKVKYDYQVIVTSNDKEAVDVWRYYLSYK